MPATAAPTVKLLMPQCFTRFPLDYVTIAERLREAGYATAHFGKWHLGWPPYGPENQGFHSNLPGGSYPGPPSYFAPYKMGGFPNGPDGEHIDERLTRHAVEFMEKNRGRPFFLNYWMFSVHAPYQAKTNLIERYRARIRPRDPQRCATMGGMIHTMDACVGRVLGAVDRLGLARNTLIIFTSDNGGNMYDHVEETTPTSNSPLRNGKGTIYEGGIRVPLIVIWPGVVKPGSRSDAIVSSIDYHPTLLEILGLAPKPGQVMDGASIVPALKRTGPVPRDAIFCHFPHTGAKNAHGPATSVRQGDWKLIRFHCDGPGNSDRFELYNLKDDIGETKNLADAMPDKVKELDALVSAHLKATAALVPVPNPAFDPGKLPVRGWRPSAQCSLSLKDGLLRIQSTGGDPNISTSDVPAVAGEFVLKLRMRSTSKGEGHFYWGTKKAPQFSRKVRLDLHPKHDGQWHDYQVRFTTGSALAALRIDPGSAAGLVEVDSARLCRKDGAELKAWTFRE
jgi:arylsulfatase A-like enzyme